MITNLSGMGVSVPNGFATTADAFNQFLDQSGVNQRIYELLDKTDIDDVTQLAKAGAQIRQWIIDTPSSLSWKMPSAKLMHSFPPMTKTPLCGALLRYCRRYAGRFLCRSAGNLPQRSGF